MMSCLVCGAVALGLASSPEPLTAQERPAASGWLQLDRDQQVYRQQVEPLDLGEERALGIIERQQRLDLRGVEQRQRRAERLETRVRTNRSRAMLGADREAARRQTVERQRARVQSQQRGLPFGRMPR
jgi:hypothetical protein